MKTMMDFTTKDFPTWCPWCGDFGILTSVRQSLAALNVENHNTMLVWGIWCGTLIPYWVKTYGALTLHGRAVPFATGVKVSNPNLKVLVNSWDGDGLWIGLWHYAHFFRRNLDITMMINNNGVYGLTKGQTSPVAKKWTKTVSTPFGSIEEPVNWLALAVTMWATFIARWYSGDVLGLTAILKAAMEHKGSAVVEILQPCVSFNKVETYQFYMERVEKSDVMFDDKQKLYEFVTTPQDKIPTWVFYRENRETYEEHLPQYKKWTLVEHDISDIKMNIFVNSRK